MVVAGDRPSAIARLRRALDEVEVAGIQTTLPFHRAVARDGSFAAADLSIDWVEAHWDGPAQRSAAAGEAAVAVVLAAAGPGAPATGRAVAHAAATPDASAWRSTARADAIDRWPR